MNIGKIRLRTQRGTIPKAEPTTCEHEWEPHVWDDGKAYCNKCGSHAEWLDDPRLTKEP